ncbi:hypothetical protein ACTOB_004107 [Actinoplanes oblitus]|uniref:BACON domain-containing protein n=1 Tax=Actinoplanes oblitus TaxID=3040509 RepID=A0ABY8WSF1_9ACTN|nr:hypothetical protein [Actinoplanes oblitus]WIN00403.1 hypothetical protein ACTOB_004107 [Actinoplanes oblitus]
MSGAQGMFGPQFRARMMMLRPGLDLERLRRMGSYRPGVPRSQVTVPISPDGRVDDTVLYQDHADATTTYYLPRYRLRVTPAGQYEITTELVDGLWRMTFGLESFPAPEITQAGARILPHQLAVTVSSAGQLSRDYPVAEFTPGFGDAQVRPEVVLRLTLPERDALLRAFTRDDEPAQLVVRRAVTVAVPQAVRAPVPAVLAPARTDQLGTHVMLPDLAAGHAFGGVVVGGTRLPIPGHPFPGPFPRPYPWPFPRPVPAGPGPVVVDPVPVPVPDPEPRYLPVSTTAEFAVPLRFDVAAHPYLFPSGQPPAAKGFTTLVVPWPPDGPSSRNHVYFQDLLRGDVFYYLPDAVLIGQRDEAPYGPELSFTVGRATDAQTGKDHALALISVHLVPQSSPARLFAAANVLAGHVPAGRGAPQLRPAVRPATCRLDLPGGPVTTAAAPDLVRGWWVAESFPFEDLRDIYVILTGGGAASALLRGRVDVDVNDETHQVPVELRLARPATPPLSWTEHRQPDGSLTVSLHNDGEATLTVPRLPAWIDATPVTPDGALPATLAPGTGLDLTVAPGPTSSEITLDVTGVRVVMDREQAVRLTLDRRVERLPRQVTVLTTEGGLEPDLEKIGVQFEGVADSVLLDRGTLQREVPVPVPLADWLLDRGLGTFRFRQTLVYRSGTSSADTDWRSSDTNLLTLPLP